MIGRNYLKVQVIYELSAAMFNISYNAFAAIWSLKVCSKNGINVFALVIVIKG